MSAELDGAGFVDCDVPGLHRKHPLTSLQQTIDDSTVGLGSTNKKEYICIGAAYGFSDSCLGLRAERIISITGLLLEIGLRKALQDFRMRPFGIVASE